MLTKNHLYHKCTSMEGKILNKNRSFSRSLTRKELTHPSRFHDENAESFHLISLFSIRKVIHKAWHVCKIISISSIHLLTMNLRTKMPEQEAVALLDPSRFKDKKVFSLSSSEKVSLEPFHQFTLIEKRVHIHVTSYNANRISHGAFANAFNLLEAYFYKIREHVRITKIIR